MTIRKKSGGDLADDMLYGAPAIARFLGQSERRVRYLADKKLLPIFWVGNRMNARKSTLTEHIERLESEGGAA